MRRTIVLALCLFAASIVPSPLMNAAPTQSDSGIRGRVVLGPLTPSTQVGERVREQPFQTTLDIVKAEDESLVIQIRTRPNGRFVVGLEPGDYIVRSASSDETRKRPSIEPAPVTVPPHTYVDVTISADTGIR
jgi:hypothetical protein